MMMMMVIKNHCIPQLSPDPSLSAVIQMNYMEFSVLFEALIG